MDSKILNVSWAVDLNLFLQVPWLLSSSRNPVPVLRRSRAWLNKWPMEADGKNIKVLAKSRRSASRYAHRAWSFKSSFCDQEFSMGRSKSDQLVAYTGGLHLHSQGSCCATVSITPKPWVGTLHWSDVGESPRFTSNCSYLAISKFTIQKIISNSIGETQNQWKTSFVGVARCEDFWRYFPCNEAIKRQSTYWSSSLPFASIIYIRRRTLIRTAIHRRPDYDMRFAVSLVTNLAAHRSHPQSTWPGQELKYQSPMTTISHEVEPASLPFQDSLFPTTKENSSLVGTGPALLSSAIVTYPKQDYWSRMNGEIPTLQSLLYSSVV